MLLLKNINSGCCKKNKVVSLENKNDLCQSSAYGTWIRLKFRYRSKAVAQNSCNELAIMFKYQKDKKK